MPAPSDACECAFTGGDAPFAREIADQSGIMLAVTCAANPSSDHLARQFRDARLLCGWVAPSRATTDGRTEKHALPLA